MWLGAEVQHRNKSKYNESLFDKNESVYIARSRRIDEE